MSYLVLARKYRPAHFGDVVGQEAVARTLSNAIRSERAGHAYLFAGPRGVGKTSMARILSKALNCAEGIGTDPCGRCEMCVAIAKGTDTDVLEIDGASNRGIEEVRAIRDNAVYHPSRSRFRIFIIDEVHMLTTPAFNALLKILEEPPAHVKFILATTQPQNVPETIRSRCQRFDFRPISPEAVAKRLEEICEQEGVEVEKNALAAVAHRGRGSMRDAQSLLDQVFALGTERVRARDVRAILGWVSTEDLVGVMASIAGNDAGAILARVASLLEGGQDPGEFLLQLGEYLRDLLIVKSCGGEAPVAMVSGVPAGDLEAQAKGIPAENLMYMLQVAQETRRRLSRDVEGRILLEMALLRMGSLRDLEPIDEALGRLEDADAGPVPSSGGSGPAPGKEKGEKRAAGAEESWPGMVEALHKEAPQLAAYLREGRIVSSEGSAWVVGFPADRSFHKERVTEAENKKRIEALVRRQAGAAVTLSFVSLEEKKGGVFEGVEEAETPAGGRTPAREEEPAIVQKAKKLFRGKVVED